MLATMPESQPMQIVSLVSSFAKGVAKWGSRRMGSPNSSA